MRCRPGLPWPTAITARVTTRTPAGSRPRCSTQCSKACASSCSDSLDRGPLQRLLDRSRDLAGTRPHAAGPRALQAAVLAYEVFVEVPLGRGVLPGFLGHPLVERVRIGADHLLLGGEWEFDPVHGLAELGDLGLGARFLRTEV